MHMSLTALPMEQGKAQTQEQTQTQMQEQTQVQPLPKIYPLWKDFTYFSHQLEGITWMLDKEINGTLVPTRNYTSNVTVHGGFQCDDMGLGKTIQIASVIYNHTLQSTLILAPLAMVDTWTSVCKRMGVRAYEVNDGAWTCMNDPAAGIPRRFMKNRPAAYITNSTPTPHSFAKNGIVSCSTKLTKYATETAVLPLLHATLSPPFAGQSQVHPLLTRTKTSLASWHLLASLIPPCGDGNPDIWPFSLT